jgi:hypothetical protein
VKQVVWFVGCLVAALAGALVAGCSDGHGPVNGSDSPEAYEEIDAPLFVYEILADRMAADSTAIDILDMLSEPRVEQLLMNHVPEELVHVQAKREAAAAFGIDSVVCIAGTDILSGFFYCLYGILGIFTVKGETADGCDIASDKGDRQILLF